MPDTKQLCPRWPLDLFQINGDTTVAAGANSIYIGPTGPANTRTAWVLFQLYVGITGAYVAGGLVQPVYQFNASERERDTNKRIVWGFMTTDSRSNFPIIGANSHEEGVGVPVISSRPRPLYLPHPHEFLISLQGMPAGRLCTIRGLAAVVPIDMDVSSIL